MEFPSGITAIVGPNGSGKSNVVDAIRWLLGEREAKYLRGAKVEDLIFAGTAKRPRLGMAQANLHLDNHNKFFPADFSEILVGRQVSRDGASRYFLNKSEILLRDLVDFFAKARLGSRGLVIVTQGNSDIFIQSTPKERREMIEEILGLREYQIKKNDAERRLKNTEINLDKVSALTEEILPHLRSLKRQTSRWEKRGLLEEELKNLENEFFGSQIIEIEKKKAALNEKMASEKEKLKILENDLREAEKERIKIEDSQPKERDELKKIKGQIQDLIAKKNSFEKDIGRLEAMIEMGRVAPQLDDALEAALELLKEIKDDLETGLQGDMVELRYAAEAVIEKIEDILSKKNKQEESLPPDLKAQLEKIEKELAGLDSNTRLLKEEEKKLESGQEAFYKAFKDAIARVEKVKDTVERWQLSNKEFLFEKEKLELHLSEIKRQIIQAGRDFNEFSGAADAGKQPSVGFADAEKRIFKIRGDLASIGEIDEALMKEARETEERYEFLKKESGDLTKAIFDLRALIGGLDEKIKTEFERALIKINEEFSKFFDLMFGGGRGKLKIESGIKNKELRNGETIEEVDANAERSENENKEKTEQETGILIDVKLPRKKTTSLEMLSGGERSLVGIAAIFALVSVSPPPFLVLDEIDAALDDRNARRFAEMLKEFSKETQFIVVTHNRATMEVADVLYGVTLNDDGTSKLVSVKLEKQY